MVGLPNVCPIRLSCTHIHTISVAATAAAHMKMRIISNSLASFDLFFFFRVAIISTNIQRSFSCDKRIPLRWQGQWAQDSPSANKWNELRAVHINAAELAKRKRKSTKDRRSRHWRIDSADCVPNALALAPSATTITFRICCFSTRRVFHLNCIYQFSLVGIACARYLTTSVRPTHHRRCYW